MPSFARRIIINVSADSPAFTMCFMKMETVGSFFRFVTNGLHGVTFQKTVNLILTAVKILNISALPTLLLSVLNGDTEIH